MSHPDPGHDYGENEREDEVDECEFCPICLKPECDEDCEAYEDGYE